MSQKSSFPVVVLAVLAAAALALSACGSDDEQTSAAGTATDETDQSDENDDDHGDEDHDDDEDHGDEDHEEDHDGDDDHDDEDHDDEDHDDSSSGLGAHEHGVAELAVAWNEGEMVIDLISPTQNIFGFEYEAVTDEDLALVADRTEALSEPGIIAINAEAGCDLTDDVLIELEYEGSHAELTASWLLSCENPDDIAQLDTAALFAEFPNLEDIDAQWASDSGQSAAELSPSVPDLSFE